MHRINIIVIISLLLINSAFGKNLSRSEYIVKYQDIAIEEMKRTGIPASITMSQALLESNDGNSMLAKTANNHFGIKCHNWNGPSVKHNDDRRKECFRKYSSPLESYKDHSDFLVKGSRYRSLFMLKSTDYKNWAKGLKKAGYATNRHYADMLIKIIEDNKLYLLDQNIAISNNKKANTVNNKSTKVEQSENWEIDIYNNRKIQFNNRIKFVYAKDGDKFYDLAKEIGVMEWQLYKYNELPKESTLAEGQIIYIQPKRNKAEYGKKLHIVKAGETMYSISQLYGIKLKKLYKKNSHIPEATEPSAGTKVFLRKKDKI